MEVNLENLHMDVGAEIWFCKILSNKYGSIQKFSQTCYMVNLNGTTIEFYPQILIINFIG